MGLLALIPVKDWLYVGAILALLAGFGWYTAHERNIGKAHELAAVAAEAAAQTKAAQAKADAAEHSHDSELAALSAYRDSHPDLPVQLCLDPSAVPAPRGVRSIHQATGATAGSVQPVPTGNSGGGARTEGPNIFPMLDALAARADEVSAQLRTYQKVLP